MKKIASVVLGTSLLLGGVFGFQTPSEASPKLKTDEIVPLTIFAPDRCTTVYNIEPFGSGWYINDGYYFLDKAAKEGLKNPKVGDNIDLMVDSKNRVVGWKVT